MMAFKKTYAIFKWLNDLEDVCLNLWRIYSKWMELGANYSFIVGPRLAIASWWWLLTQVDISYMCDRIRLFWLFTWATRCRKRAHQLRFTQKHVKWKLFFGKDFIGLTERWVIDGISLEVSFVRRSQYHQCVITDSPQLFYMCWDLISNF